MPLPVIANVFRVSFKWTAGTGQISVNVLHVRSLDDELATLGHVQDALHAISGVNNPWALLSNAYSLTDITCLALDGTSAGVTQGPLDVWIGGGGGNQIPNVAMIASFHTGFRGSRGRGRNYVGPLGETDTDNGKISGALATAVLAHWNAWFAALVTEGATPVVASYVHADAHTIDAVQIKTHCGSQRRRLRRS